MSLTSLPISKIRRDGGTQVRTETSHDVAAHYGALLLDGAELPAPVAFEQGPDLWLADGFHTLLAFELIGKKRVEVDVREGTLADAITYATGANARHAFQLNQRDRRRAVELLLDLYERDVGWSNVRIAKHVGVTEKTVRNIRAERRLDRQAEAARAAAPSVADSESPSTPADELDEQEWKNQLPPDQATAWDAMDDGEKDQFRQRARADALDGRVIEIEKRIARIKKKLTGSTEQIRHLHLLLDQYLDRLAKRIGWEKRPTVILGEELKQELAAELGWIQRQHAELPQAQDSDADLAAFAKALAAA